MSKRSLEPEDGERPPKRPRPDIPRAPPAIEEIHYARQLQQLLTFRQDGIHQLRNGIASFKAFLESILYHKEEDNRARQLSILREFLDTQKPEDLKDTERPFLGQLWQAWSFANQNNNDHLSSQVAAVLALLLRTLSSLLDFRDHGILLCRTVLLHPHLRLVKRCLDAPKHKDFIISPCLRLLTEVTSFDGGVLAREVYKRREQTFDIGSLRRNLGLVRHDVSEEEARKKPSIRSLTVRYILAHVKYLHEGGKIDLLKSRPLCVSLFQHLPDDPAELVNEILSVCEQNVLRDSELPRSAKATLLVQHNLERVTDVATRSANDHPAASRAFIWLKAVCSTQSYGVLRVSGWYPAGTTKDDAAHTSKSRSIDLGLDSLSFYDRQERPDVRNSTLLGWLQTLRPHADLRERELAIACFESAPELVAAYFAEKNMQLDPKLTNTWIGYASFLFEVIQLPKPRYLGNLEDDDFAELPPQTSIVLENILPKPLTEKILTRCLNQSSDLITFFVVRLLVLALQKVREILADFDTASSTTSGEKTLWSEARERLLSRLTARVPSIKDVINTFRRLPDDVEHALQREATTRLLRLYYEVTPIQALEEQFDVSAALNAALVRNGEDTSEDDTAHLRSLELEHLLVIAQRSSGMRWFNKQGSQKHLPITTLLQLHVDDHQNRQIRSLLLQVLQAQDIILDDAELSAIIASLLAAEEAIDEVCTFLDECMTRASKQPVKYLDQLEAVELLRKDKKSDTSRLPGLLLAVVAEQAPFAAKMPDVLEFVWRYINNAAELNLCGVEDDSPRLHIADALRKRLQKELLGFTREAFGIVSSPADWLERARLPQAASEVDVRGTPKQAATALDFATPPAESDNHPELVRWAQKDLGVAVEEGDIEKLMLCLCSQHSDIRKQALSQLRNLGARLRTSALDEKDQLSVLIGELTETFEQQCLGEDIALPYLAGTFATKALQVLQEPTHHIYPKLNRYLIKSPEWRISRMPSHWLTSTILAQPEEDDAYWKEIQWVLDWLVEGLRTPADLDILRKGGVFEKVMALYSSPAASAKLVKEKVLELLWRATCVEGGSTMLITRTGALAWLDMVKKVDGDLAALMKRRVLETCDRERIAGWSGVEVDVL